MFRPIGFALVLSLTTIVAAQPPTPPPATPPPAAPTAQPPAAPAAPAQPAPAGQPAGPQQPTPTFRGGIDVVSLNVTVTDGGKTFVRDLDRGEFAVFEDGVKQELTYFTKAQLPIALSLLIDTSA